MPTMEMIRSQFDLHPEQEPAPTILLQVDDQEILGDVSSAPVTVPAPCHKSGLDLRLLAEQSLAEERAGQLNQLGAKIQEQWNVYQELLGLHTQVAFGTEDSDSV